MKNLKTFFTKAIFTAALAAAVIPVGANASAKKLGKCGDNAYATYNSSTKTVSIKGKGDMYSFAVVPAPWAKVDVEHVEIGDKITSIGEAAFFSSNIQTVKLSNSVKTIEDSAFEDCALTSVTIPKGVTRISETAFFGDAALKSIKVSRENKKYSAKDGVLFNKNKSSLLFYPEGKDNNHYTVPSSVRRIKTGAFSGYAVKNVAPRVKTLTMPKKIKVIENYSFDESKIQTISFPGNRPQKIGRCAFGENDSLTIRCNAKKWPASSRHNFGAKKIRWR